MKTITKDLLLQIAPRAKNSKLDIDALVVELVKLQSSDLNTLNRISAFIAQTAHESAEYNAVVENLNYSKEGLMKVFHKYFPTEELASQYARNPSRIASKVYANRMGNGPEETGDGFKFRGRGFIQLTGKDTYKKFGDFCGKDLLSDQDYLTTMEGAVKSAHWFWTTRNLNVAADMADIKIMTKTINGGYNGLEERTKIYDKAREVLA